MKKLPIKLDNSPLLGARVEFRFKTDNILIESFVFQFLSNFNSLPELKLDRLPIMDIPKQVRDIDPNLIYAPLKKIYSNHSPYDIFVGDRLLSVSCKMPYRGWSDFREYLTRLIDSLKNNDSFWSQVDHVSISYMDFIDRSFYGKTSDAINWTIKFDEHNLSDNDDIFIRTSIKEDNCNVIVQIVSNARVEGIQGSGLVIEIHTENKLTDDILIRDCNSLFNKLHNINKEKFFMCLTGDLLNKLGPHYD